jgi:hypothetical protein
LTAIGRMWEPWNNVVVEPYRDIKVDSNDTDEDIARAIGIIEIQEIDINNKRRRNQLTRWHWGYNNDIKKILKKCRRRWAYVICKFMRDRQLRRRKLLALMVQRQRLRSIVAFETFWMQHLHNGFNKLPNKMKMLIAHYV